MDLEPQPRSVLACELVADVASNFGEVSLKVTGASMIPAIWPGDVITVRRSELASLQPGQIVLSRQRGGLVAHRITAVQGNHLTTRGDSLQCDDPPVTEFDIVGQVVGIVRDGRRVRLDRSVWQSACSSILRHSDFCLRMAVFLGYRLRRATNGEMSWAR